MSIARYEGVDRYVGNTPLIRLRCLSELTGCEILGKAEFMNPGGSVKDRAAYGIITDAEQKGLLKPGAMIVEGTAGNTGIGLALIGHARGYRIVIVIPKTQSPEKLSLLRTLGAEVIAVPEKPYRDPTAFAASRSPIGKSQEGLQISLGCQEIRRSIDARTVQTLKSNALRGGGPDGKRIFVAWKLARYMFTRT